MSGNASRKYKQYKKMIENRKLFGNMAGKNEYGYTDLVPMSTARGEIIIKKREQCISTGDGRCFLSGKGR